MNNLCTLSKRKPCNFCNSCVSDDLKMGKLYQFENIVAHYYCLLLSSGLCQNGKDNEGILGFLPSDVTKELNRGNKLRCSACKKTGATIGCCNKACKKVFHLPCSLKRDSLHLFYENFMTYCKEHKPRIKPTSNYTKKDECFICLESMDLKDPYYAITPPCCKNGHFHKQCLQKQAISAGYFFKCPLCNNTEEFKEEMLSKGIFIPEQDAAWELEQNAFQDLYIRHSRCDATECLCPMGNDYDKDDCPWEVILCRHCGSHGCHMECGKIPKSKLEWQCPSCLEVINKLKTKTENAESILNDEGPSDIIGTPKNTKLPSTPKRRRRRFAQLNEYNLSPNGPISKDDDCSLIRRSPRSSNSRFGERLRCSTRLSLREYIENERKLTKQRAISQPSTSKSQVETSTTGVEPKTECKDQDENIPRASTSKVDDTTLYSKPAPKSRKRPIRPKIELKTESNTQDENIPRASSTSMNDKEVFSRSSPKSKKKYENIETSKCLVESKPDCVEETPTLPSRPCKTENPSQTIYSYFNSDTDVICINPSPRISKMRTRAKASNKGNGDIRQYFCFTK